MDGDKNDDTGISVSLPVGVIATGLLIGVAASIAYVLVSRQDDSGESAPSRSRPKGGGIFRRVGLVTLISLIENDATRKVLVTVLRAIARRS